MLVFGFGRRDCSFLIMAVRRVIKYWESSAGVLRQVCRRIKIDQGCSESAAEDLLATAVSNSCLGLAAPQIGLTSRMFVMRHFFGPQPCAADLFRVISNPEILWRSSTKSVDYEGCLSIPNTQFSVARPDAIVVAFDDALSGKKSKQRLQNKMP